MAALDTAQLKRVCLLGFSVIDRAQLTAGLANYVGSMAGVGE